MILAGRGEAHGARHATSPVETEQLLPVLNLHITTTKMANRTTTIVTTVSTCGTSPDKDKLEDDKEEHDIYIYIEYHW